MQGANIALAEKSGQLVMANREMDYKNNILNQLEEKVRSEKVGTRCAVKITELLGKFWYLNQSKDVKK